MYKVRVPICSPHHNSELSTVFYNVDVATSRSTPKLKLFGMNTLLQILKLTLSTSNILLRPLLISWVKMTLVIYDCLF